MEKIKQKDSFYTQTENESETTIQQRRVVNESPVKKLVIHAENKKTKDNVMSYLIKCKNS